MGFVSELLGANNDFKSTPADLANTEYGDELKKLLAGQNVVDNSQSNQTRDRQNDLSNALLKLSRGEGPSIAENQLQRTTDQNIAQNSGMIGSQKGMNPALAARLILNNAAQANQNAAGQASLLRAQEQYGTNNALGSILNEQRNQDINQALGQSRAGTERLGTVGQLQNNQNAGRISNTLGSQQLNAGVSSDNQKVNAGIAGGLLSSMASGASMMSMGGGGGGGGMPMGGYNGGLVRGYSDGGFAGALAGMDINDLLGDKSVGEFTPMRGSSSGALSGMDAGLLETGPVTKEALPNKAELQKKAAGNKPIWELNNREAAGFGIGSGIGNSIKSIARIFTGGMGSEGGYVAGKASVSGNHPKNDTVPAMLSPGEIVIPRTAANDPAKAKSFIDEIMKNKGAMLGDEPTFGHVIASQRGLHNRLLNIEKMFRGGMA